MSVHPGSIWIDNNWQRLFVGSSYWLAVDDQYNTTEAPTYDDLINRLNVNGIDLDRVAIVHIQPGIVQ